MSYAWTTSELIDEIHTLKDLAKSRLQWQEAAHYLQEAIDHLEYVKEEEETEVSLQVAMRPELIATGGPILSKDEE
tara:strand:- start:94 stop:321 length:228 start_codon:yes stop_codon:yes gene_type:complete